MKQSLQLRIGQSLTMTPQLQQAIRLLQLSTLELQQEIQTVLESNIMLEIPEEESTKSEQDKTEKEASPEEKTSEGSQEQMPDELPVDSTWDDVYDLTGQTGASQNTDAIAVDPGSINSAKETLQDHLLWQLELTNFSDKDRVIAFAIVDAIGDDGYLTLTLDAIFEHLVDHLDDLELDEAVAVLHTIQSFDPPGIAAYDLQECLLLQLKQLPQNTPLLSTATLLVQDHMSALGSQDSNKIKRLLGLNDDLLTQTLTLIQSLNPRPGSVIQPSETQYIVPDVYVRKLNGEWQVSLNGDVTKTIQINAYYQSLIKRGDKSKDGQAMKEHLQEARWFIKSLESRHQTLMRVSTEIVRRQQGFLEHGAIAMKPMVLRDIAEKVEMHESTISRVTTNKYMHTPNGIFELKHFFSSHVSTDTGGECSATAIRAIIQELVDSEDRKKPLSDNKIAAILLDKGINVARRTIAKYRESISIPPSSQRKRIL
ncbi:MAG: RNA polymerase factor sigma-54 [Piscirickettsiaceae bacterium]|nr:MAG: RNA polymerase factor sigma-54 [Piscirickettsiaceae bacterium]